MLSSKRRACARLSLNPPIGHDAIAPALPLDDPDAIPSDHATSVAEEVPSAGDFVVVAQSLGAFISSASLLPSYLTFLRWRATSCSYRLRLLIR